MRLFTSVVGTFETCRDVRSMVAIGGKADVARIADFGSDWTHSDISQHLMLQL